MGKIVFFIFNFLILGLLVIIFVPNSYAVPCTVGNVTLDCADGSGCSYSRSLGYYCKGGFGGSGTTDTTGGSTGSNTGGTTVGTTGDTTTTNVTPTTTCNGGECCTQNQLNMGIPCSIKNPSAGCGCPTGWSCYYLGRQNTDGSQTIQCVPPLTGGQKTGETNGNIDTNTGAAGGNKPTCDPVEDGKIDVNDFNLWKQEYLRIINTSRSACMSPNNAVDLLGFQAWKNIAVLHIRQSF